MSKVDNYTVHARSFVNPVMDAEKRRRARMNRKLERIRARRRFVKRLPSIISDSSIIALFIVPPMAFILTLWAGIWLLSAF